MLTKDNYFETLSKEALEMDKKGTFNYSSWSDVWDFLKKKVPDARFEWVENQYGTLGLVDDFGCFAKVRVFSDSLGVDVTQYLHAMDYSNRAIRKDKLTASEINKTYQRCMVKAIAVGFGLGLYIYKGEDLPDESDGKGSGDEENPDNEVNPHTNKRKPFDLKDFKNLNRDLNEGGIEVGKMWIEDKKDTLLFPDFIKKKIEKLFNLYKNNMGTSDEEAEAIFKEYTK